MQKFYKHDLVLISPNLGQFMSHFPAGCRAIVIGSYADQYGGKNTNEYMVFVEGKGRSAWYYEHQLTLIEANQRDLMALWECEYERKHSSNHTKTDSEA